MSALTLTSAAASKPLSAPELTTGTRARALKVGGLTPFSATAYPGKLVAVVFVQGCPWACGYCHNPHLQTRSADSPQDWSLILARLRRRVGLIDAVVFSGGEPTIDPALEDAMRDVRALGFGVGLHTAGTYPRRLAEVLPLVDWVGIDVKASFDHYDAITRITDSGRQALASAELVLASGVPHEFRTTIHPDLHTEADILALAARLSAMGVKRYALQQFRATGCQDRQLASGAAVGVPSETLLTRLAALFDGFIFRQS